MAGAPPWDEIRLEDPRFVELGRGVVALVYTARARRGSEPYRAALTSVYRERNGDWQLVLHQQTPLADAPADNDA